MDAGQRKELYKRAHDLYGSQLAKTIQEELTVVKRQTQTAKYKEEGRFVLPSDAEEMPRFARNPQALEHIKVHSESFTCPVSGEVHVYIPEYSFSKEDVIEQQKIQSRSVMADGKIANPKGAAKEGTVSAHEPKAQKLAKGLLIKVVGY